MIIVGLQPTWHGGFGSGCMALLYPSFVRMEVFRLMKTPSLGGALKFV